MEEGPQGQFYFEAVTHCRRGHRRTLLYYIRCRFYSSSSSGMIFVISQNSIKLGRFVSIFYVTWSKLHFVVTGTFKERPGAWFHTLRIPRWLAPRFSMSPRSLSFTICRVIERDTLFRYHYAAFLSGAVHNPDLRTGGRDFPSGILRRRLFAASHVCSHIASNCAFTQFCNSWVVFAGFSCLTTGRIVS